MSKAEDSVRRPARGPRVGLAQISPALGDLASNLERHRHAVAKAAEDGCDLLVFPELSLAGYRLKDSVPEVAIRRDDETWKQLEELSSQVALVVGFVEETPEHLFYNSAAYFEGGRCVAVHRKTYLPTYGMFDEQRYFARGRRIEAFDTKVGRVAILVCEDMLHPSALTVAACDGATLVIVPSASPARGVVDTGEADSNARSWEAYNHVLARTFGLWVAYCNRVGVEDGVTFWGGAEIVSPAGERVVKASYYDEDYVSAVLADDAVRRRRIANPMVRDEDLDLTINELSRIRGRATESATEERPRRAGFAPGGDAPPRRRERDDRPAGDGDEGRGGFAPPRRRDDDGPRGGFGDRRPRPAFGGGPSRPPRPRFDDDRGERGGGFGPPRRRDDDGPPRGRFDGPPRGGFDGPPRGRFDGPPRGRCDGPPRGRFDGPPRGRFDGPPRERSEGPPRGPRGDFGDKPRFGGGGFGDKPRFGGGGGGFGGKPRFGGGGGGFGGKPRFGDDAPPRPRERERPEPGRKPFGAKPFGGKPFGGKPFGGPPKPRGRGRKGD